MIRALLLVLLLALPGAAGAISDPAEMLPDQTQERRAESIGRQLRCLVCQNESIEDSNADLARDLRRLVRQKVAAGATDDAATAWVVSRYGDFVRLRPPFNAVTALLWASPAVAVCIGLGSAILSRRRRAAGPAPLSAAEEVRLRELTGR